MKYWFDVSSTIPKGLGFSHFDPIHLCWLVLSAAMICATTRLYRTSGRSRRDRMRKTLAAAIVGNEVFKTAMLLIGGNYDPEYLPLHLCSVNILLIGFHAFRPSKLLDNFLYAVCIPGALAALLFPSWNKLPQWNFMNLHSFTVHMQLMAYPIMLAAGGDIRPDPKQIPRVLGLLGTLALIAQGANRIFGTNFMFLAEAGKSNPLYIFEKLFGSHLVGIAILLPVVLGVMYAPYLRRRGHTAAHHRAS